jgi:predicted 3-demethylubiquinone-9 3-methyltransferase (glyoxalase superfamily)
MHRFTPHLWFDTQAQEAAELYTSLFEGSEITSIRTLRDTPSGDADVVSFVLSGQPFMAISAGPLFTFNPSVSFMVPCDGPEEVDRLWTGLIDGGSALMPLAEYPFSPRYGWVQDRYGLSWQIGQFPPAAQRIVPALLFVGDVAGKAEEAIGLYTSVFDDAEVGQIQRYGAGAEPEREGTVMYADFALEGYGFAAMDSSFDHGFAFNEAVSFMIHCDTQQEIDRYWESLSADPAAEQCGWLKDRFGLSWQVVPRALDRMMAEADDETLGRVTRAFLGMKKFDLAQLEAAYAGS